MFTTIQSLHRFFARNSFYPLMLSTLLALGFFAWRAIYTDRWWEYRLLVWNLFLAWIPYGCALLAAALYQLRPSRWWLLIIPGFLWLLFVPNAPYIVTDFYHLEWRWPVPLWYDIGLIAIFAITGCFLAIASLRIMQRLVMVYTGKVISWLFALVSIGLCGLGIYLGRFGRYNSWDMVFHPTQVLREIAHKVINPLDNMGFIGFTLMFTTILLVFYLMFVSNNRLEEENVER
jgi:uncharacterized membrane protein